MAEAKQEVAAGGSKKKMIILMVVAMLLAVGGAVGATMFIMGGKADEAATADKDQAAQDAGDENAADAEDGDEKDVAAEGEEGKGAAPLYVALDPAFVVNFQDKQQRTKFLKAEISVVAKSAKVQEAITAHMPAVRNGVVMLLSRQIYEDLMTSEGKEKLRSDALAEVQSVMEKQAGKKVGKGVKDLYFSTLVMQ
ncbi:MAG TPA: flagellar basal body-associated FliL family protein [Gammaproteobacteria bacterium]|nr:flagellar basal body-associated FliL family protein [Gammaproteobacteria bacterium]